MYAIPTETWLASTFGDPEITTETIVNFTLSPADSQVVAGFQFFKVFDEHQLEYVMLAKGGSDDVYMVGKIAHSRYRTC